LLDLLQNRTFCQNLAADFGIFWFAAEWSMDETAAPRILWSSSRNPPDAVARLLGAGHGAQAIQ
jgi:hypothetical protein